MPVRTTRVNAVKAPVLPFLFILDGNGFTEERFAHDCDFVSELPDLIGSKVGDLAWIRENRRAYVRDEAAWVVVYPPIAASAVGVSGRDPVSPNSDSHTVIHNLGNPTASVIVAATWPTELWTDDSTRTAASVGVVFGTPAPAANAFISWRAS